MKKSIVVGGLLVFTSLFFTSGAFAEEDRPNADNATIISSILETTETTELTGTTETTVLEIEKDGMSLRELLLYFEHVPKELLDQLTDEQLQELDDLTRNTFGAPSITLLERLLVRIYSPNPIPEESYLTEYAKMSPDEFKAHLPQIRLSLIHVFDVDEQKLAAISDAQLIEWIDEVTRDAISPIYWVVGLKEKVVGREISMSESSSNETIESSLDSNETSEEQSIKEQSGNEKKKGFPVTGETVRTSLIVVGVLLVIAVGMILYKRKKK